MNGKLVESTSAGRQVILSMEISNIRNMTVPFIAVIEVRQSNGITVSLAWINSTISANNTVTMDA